MGLTLAATAPIRFGIGRTAGIGFLRVAASMLFSISRFTSDLGSAAGAWLPFASFVAFTASHVGLAWRFFRLRKAALAAK